MTYFVGNGLHVRHSICEHEGHARAGREVDKAFKMTLVAKGVRRAKRSRPTTSCKGKVYLDFLRNNAATEMESIRISFRLTLIPQTVKITGVAAFVVGDEDGLRVRKRVGDDVGGSVGGKVRSKLRGRVGCTVGCISGGKRWRTCWRP